MSDPAQRAKSVKIEIISFNLEVYISFFGGAFCSFDNGFGNDGQVPKIQFYCPDITKTVMQPKATASQNISKKLLNQTGNSYSIVITLRKPNSLGSKHPKSKN